MPAGYYANYPPFQPARRRPRQPRRHNLQYLRKQQPQRNPPGIVLAPRTAAASKIQHNWRKNRQMKYNKELKHMETTANTYSLEHQTHNSVRMANGLVLYPSGFNTHNKSFLQGTSDTTIVGSWITKTYLTQKFIINWSSLTAHADLAKGPEFRCRYGYITVTPNKANCSLATASGWQTDVNAMVMRELQESGIDENHLSFARKSRTVKILSDFMIRPKLAWRASDNEAINHDFAPPTNLTINWDKKKLFSKNKTRLAPTADDPIQYVQHHQFVPFVYFSSNNITAAMGSLSIADSSKLYYADS
jgi:hypothetical protein